MKITYSWSITIFILLVACFSSYHYSSYGQKQRHIIQELWETSLPNMSEHSLPIAPKYTEILVLTFWGTWCSYCLEELPWFNKFSGENSNNIHIVAIAIDDQESVISFINSYNIQQLDVRLSNTHILSLLKQISPNFGGLPFTLMINSQYELLNQHIGNYHSYEELVLSIEKAGNNLKK